MMWLVRVDESAEVVASGSKFAGTKSRNVATLQASAASRLRPFARASVSPQVGQTVIAVPGAPRAERALQLGHSIGNAWSRWAVANP